MSSEADSSAGEVVDQAPSPQTAIERDAAGSTPERTLAERLRASVPFVAPVIGLVLGLKLLVLTFGAVVAETVGERTYPGFADRVAFWNAWDAPHYLDLARDGYQTTGDAANFIVFLPGYPYAVRIFDWIFPGGTLTSAFVVSGIASVAAALLLAHLVRHDSGGDEARAHRAVWFFLIFPTAYFLHIPYTESLFLAFVLGAFYAARTGRWGAAGLLGLLAALTRVNGAILLPALAVEAYLQYRKSGRFDWSFLWIALIGLGTLVYLGINQYYFGDPFHFQDVQREHWFKSFENPYTSIKAMIDGAGGYQPAERQMLVIQELLFLSIGLTAGVLAFVWSRASYGVWAILNVLLFASTSFIQSSPRYVITIFPIFLLLAQMRSTSWRMIISAWSLTMMAWFTTLFALGRWAF